MEFVPFRSRVLQELRVNTDPADPLLETAIHGAYDCLAGFSPDGRQAEQYIAMFVATMETGRQLGERWVARDYLRET